jgi:hypothetical protein
MTTRVYTRSECDRCDKGWDRDGAEAGLPPVRWAMVRISWRAQGDGWSGGGRTVEKTLCPECAGAVEDALIGREVAAT